MLRVRFSLRSFVLLAIVCGAAYGLWQGWDAWTETMVLKGDGRQLSKVQLGPDDRSLLSVPEFVNFDPGKPTRSRPAEAWIWNAHTGERENVICWNANWDILFGDAWLSADGKWVCFLVVRGGVGIFCRIFNAASGRDLLPDLPADAIRAVHCSSDGSFALAELAGRPPLVIGLEDGGKRLELRAVVPSKTSLEVVYSGDHRYLIVYASNKEEHPCCWVYDLESGALLHRMDVSWHIQATLAANGELLLAQNISTSSVEIWDWKRGVLSGSIEIDGLTWFTTLGQNRILAFARDGRPGAIFDVRTRQKLSEIEGGAYHRYPYSSSMRQIATYRQVDSARNGAVVADGDEKYRVMAWDGISGKKQWEIPLLGDHTIMAPGPHFSKNDQWIITPGNDVTWLCRAEDGRDQRILAGSAIFLGDGIRYVLLDNERRATVCEMETGAVLSVLMAGVSPLTRIQATRDGRRLYIADNGGDVHCFYRRRPEPWWGIAWLPELWVALVFAPALLWSFWRDFKTLRKAG